MRECRGLCYLVVISCTEEDVVGSRVPLNEAHSATVTLKLLPWYCDVLKHAVRRDLPHFDLQTQTWTGVGDKSVHLLTYFMLLLQNYSEEKFFGFFCYKNKENVLSLINTSNVLMLKCFMVSALQWF